MSDSDRLLGNLLAIIHRDGGHYQDQHGTARAATDAGATVLRDRAEIRRLKWRLAHPTSTEEAL